MIYTRKSPVTYDLNVSYIALEQLDSTLAHSDAQEAFGFAVRVVDAFARVVNNFKTGLTGFRKAFKRSELKAYHDSHQLAVRQFFKTRRFDPTLSVPIPSGMKVGYLQATTVLEALYTKLDIDDTMTALQVYFADVDKAGHLLPAEMTTARVSRLSKVDVETALRAVFTADKTLEVPAGTVIGSFDELLDIDRRILTYDPIFRHVEAVCTALDAVEKQIDALVTSLEKQAAPIDKSAVQSLYRLVRAASEALDMLGIILAECQRVEHNFVIAFRRLVGART
jgi:hypothetical protein